MCDTILIASPDAYELRLQPAIGDTMAIMSPDARERFFFRDDKGAEDEEAGLSELNALDRKGVCLPVGGQDMLIMIRDFLFSHMYVLRRETFGFAGTMVMPSAYEFFAAEVPQGMRQSQYDVVLRRVPRE